MLVDQFTGGRSQISKTIKNARTYTVLQEIFVSEKFRQKRPSGSSSGLYFRQKPVVARLLFARE